MFANAQQARRILDRLVGYELSPLLCSKIRRGLSAGRVQSVATKIVMDRDAEIDAFIPEEYWLVNALISPKNIDHKFKARFYGINNGTKIEKVKLNTKEDADKVLNGVNTSDFTATTVKKGKKQRNPYPPFTTSTLQQEASKRLGFSSRKTMSVAQQLYEGVEIKEKWSQIAEYGKSDDRNKASYMAYVNDIKEIAKAPIEWENTAWIEQAE